MKPRQVSYTPVVDVKERKGIWVEGGEGYIRFEGKCLRALEDLGRLHTFHQRWTASHISFTHEIFNKPEAFRLIYNVYMGVVRGP